MSTREIKAPDHGKKETVYIQPNEQVKLNFNLHDVKVDILGSDLVFTFKDNSQLILTNLAITLFSDNAPHIESSSGEHITSDQLLSEIGLVQSVAGQDASLLTSMHVDKDSTGDKTKDQKIVYKVRDNPPIIVQPPPTLDVSDSHSLSHGAQFEQKIQKTFDELLISRTREVEVNTNIGKYTNPPVDANPPRIQALAPISGGGFDLGGQLVFSAKLLQLSPNVAVNSGQLDYLGGTGSGAATLDPSPLTQIQSQFIDTTRNNNHTVIYANDPAFTTSTLLSRVVSIQPAVPIDYSTFSIKISGLPPAFTLRNLTADGSGNYTVSGPDITSATGPQKFIIQYDPTALPGASDMDGDSIAHEHAKFDITIDTIVVNIDTGSVITDSHIIHVIVKDTTSDDYSYTVGTDTTWVLDTKPNQNIIVAGDGGVEVHAGNYGDRVSTGSGNDDIYGGAGNDNITTAAGNDIIRPATGDNIVDGGDGNDTLTYAGRAEGVTLDLGATPNGSGFVTATIGGSQTDLVKGIENVTGGDGANTLYGNDVANILIGGASDDLLMGRGGNDTLNGGGGTNTVTYSYATNGVTVDLNAGNAVVSGSDTDTLVNIQNVTGTDYDDTLLGNSSANLLLGGQGDDLLNGRTGNDTLDGGAGINTASFADETGGVTLTLQNAGDSTATATNSDSIILRNINNLIGSSHDDTLTGNNQDNIIYGSGGNDTLDGGTSNDTLSYSLLATGVTADLGAGTVTKTGGSDSFSNFDVFTGTDHNDYVIAGSLINTINGGLGTDTLSYENTGTSVTVNMASGTTTGALTQTFTGFENITGGSAADTLTGDEGNNVITGGAGDDILNANGGSDTLDGGANNDTATYVSYAAAINVNLGAASLQVDDGVGGVSSLISIETLVGTSYDDTFNSGSTSRTISLNGGAGTDTMNFASESAAVTANLSTNATGAFGTYTFIGNSIENLTGGSGNDTLTGTSGNNVIIGGSGNDTINANGGSDTIDGDIGTDTLTYASYGAAVTMNLAALSVTDAASAVSTFSNIETLVGTDYNDTILSGLSIANFTINGGAGTDTMDFTPLQAALTVNLTSGTATVGLSSTYTLQNIENVTGGGLGDSLTGSAGNNVLNGGGGNDFFYGTTGNDILDGGLNFNYFNYGYSQGVALTANLGAADILITDGATLNSTLRNMSWIGTSNSNDTFNSGSTARTLYLDGEDGTDTLSFATETQNVNANLTVASGYYGVATGAFGTYYLYLEHIENLTGGSGNDTLVGSAYDIYGNGNNVINGGAGNDTITGNGGNDTIDGGADFDTVLFTAVTANMSITLGTLTVSYTDINGHGSTTTMSNVERISTGSGNDYFLVGGAGQTLTLDAGTGTDTIDFSSQVGAITVDMAGTSTGAFGTYTLTSADFDNLLGGSGSDTLTGNALANNIFGGNGTDTIHGGNGDDIIDDSNTTYATNHSNVIYGDAGNDTIYTYIADNTLDGGTGTNALRYDTGSNTFFNFGHVSPGALTFTLAANSSGGTVTDGTHTDTFTNFQSFYGGNGADLFVGGSGNDTFNGNNGDDVFRGRSGNDTYNGGNGVDTADYSTAAAGIVVNISANTASNDGDGGVDTYSSIENITGSIYNDTITGDNNINVLNGNDGDDTFTMGTAGSCGGNDTINGGVGTDTISYTGQSAAITFNLNTSSINNGNIGTDSYLNIEQINSGSGNDVVTTTASNLFANTVNFNLGGNTSSFPNDGDNILVTGGTVGNDATTFMSHFTNIESITMNSANTAGGNMVIDGVDVFGSTSGSHQLRLDINNAFGLTVQAGAGYTLNTSATVAGVTTYTFLAGASVAATLEVHQA